MLFGGRTPPVSHRQHRHAQVPRPRVRSVEIERRDNLEALLGKAGVTQQRRAEVPRADQNHRLQARRPSTSVSLRQSAPTL